MSEWEEIQFFVSFEIFELLNFFLSVLDQFFICCTQGFLFVDAVFLKVLLLLVQALTPACRFLEVLVEIFQAFFLFLMGFEVNLVLEGRSQVVVA